MRLFVAVDVPAEIRDAIETRVVGPLRDTLDGARWTRPDGRHLTLQFLGNVDDGRATEIGVAVRRAAAGHAAFTAAFDEIGGFPTLRRPGVLWIGIGEGRDALEALASSVHRELEPLGFPPEDRPFTAHLTLARFPRPHIVEEIADVAVPDERFDVTEIVLFRSHLHPKGARYEALERIGLR